VRGLISRRPAQKTKMPPKPPIGWRRARPGSLFAPDHLLDHFVVSAVRLPVHFHPPVERVFRRAPAGNSPGVEATAMIDGVFRPPAEPLTKA
jgi:hypothetical protein